MKKQRLSFFLGGGGWGGQTRCIMGDVQMANRPFSVVDGSEADGDLVLIQTFLLYYVNQVILMLTSIFQGKFP